MSRPRRVWYPGATYHVMSRGNRRLVLYKDHYDYLSFLEGILRTKEKYSFKIHSICLMSNHFHMIIETANDELWKIMQRMLHPYSMNFNRKYDYTGHLFEHRYISCLISDERYLLEVSRYIHLNPVKAQIVRGPLDYEYSSYKMFVEGPGRDGPTGKHRDKVSRILADLVTTDRVLSVFQYNDREQYRMFVEGKISHEEQEMLIRKDMKEDDMWLPW